MQCHGSPTQSIVKVSMTVWYRKRTDKFLAQNRDHAAVLATIDKLNQILAMARPATVRPRRGDWRSRAHNELHRLTSMGVTGEEVLGRLLPIWYLAHADSAFLEPLSIPHRYACARHTLNLRDRSNKEFRASAGTRCGSKALNWLGERLVNATLGLAQAMLKSFDEADRADLTHRETVQQAVEAVPLKPTAEPVKRSRRPSTPTPTPTTPTTPAGRQPQAQRAPITETLPDGTILTRF
jgi:hypothetical protein